MAGIALGLIGSFPTPVTSSFESIASATGTGSNFSVEFTSIPSTYSHLQIRIVANGNYTSSSLTGSIGVTFNSDTGANYSYHRLSADGATVAAAGTADSTSMIFNTVPYGSTYANIYGAAIVDIADYASTTKNKTMRVFCGTDANGAGNIRLTSGLWMSTSAVTSVKLTASSAITLNTPTTFALYGIKGA
jgi:hypothetical protein